jgi:hypothetical protein
MVISSGKYNCKRHQEQIQKLQLSWLERCTVIDLMHNDVTRLGQSRGMLVLVVITREN